MRPFCEVAKRLTWISSHLRSGAQQQALQGMAICRAKVAVFPHGVDDVLYRMVMWQTVKKGAKERRSPFLRLSNCIWFFRSSIVLRS